MAEVEDSQRSLSEEWNSTGMKFTKMLTLKGKHEFKV